MKKTMLLLGSLAAITVMADELPIVDISQDAFRQTVIAEGTPEVYQGHPTTLLAADGKTMFCVWTINHGGACGPAARSDDGGRTWTRIDGQLPEEYKQHRNCPTLQTVPRPDGSGVNYCVFSANCVKGTGGGLGILMSRDLGKSWQVMPPAPHLSAGMPPTGFMPLKDGTCALFGQIRKNAKVKTDRPKDDQAVWMSISKDGGATWGPSRIVAQKDEKNLCEPFALRSPDGGEIALLMRENRHTARSMMCFSRDEGKTWTEPVDTCWGLTGDRHEGVRLPDGRWVIAFRDRALKSSTYGQYMAWVGTYDDIRNGRPGQCRIHLLKHYPSKEYGWSKFDTGYSGVELLPDGTIVCTTYTKHWPDDRKSSVVSTRFKIDEIDARLRADSVLTLSLDDYRDKMKAAWVGQMVGVSWGQPTEFKWKDAIIPEDKVPVWASDFPLRMAYGNDDLYVEMTFLKTLEDHGLDASIRQAGIDFANSEYRLWCANRAGRNNLRRGIAPPDCSHPQFNKCPNDIDYQIEADYAGIISPGCPQEAIRLGNVFGRLMNYGDGVWAGQFVGALYAEAFFTADVNALLDAGLAAIPAESDYAQMVRNVRAWHRENPKDWTTCWEKIRAAYSKSFNKELRDSNGGIDVRLNGACIVLGLLYGEGDLDKSMVLSMRCGWDSDCNPSNVGGILMTARGFKSLPAKYVEKLDYSRNFSYTAYNLPALFAVCEKLARQVVVRHGGRVEKGADGVERFVIPVKKPDPDPFVPSWKAPPAKGERFTEAENAKQKFRIILPDPDKVYDPDPTIRVQKTLDVLFPGWKTSTNAPDMTPGLVEELETTRGTILGAVRTHPPKQGEAVTLSRTCVVPNGNPMFHFAVANSPGGDFRLIVRVNGTPLLSTVIDDSAKRCHLRTFDISLEPWTGKNVTIELVNEPTGWHNEAALWTDIRLTANSGTTD